jgi:hypothetical protein
MTRAQAIGFAKLTSDTLIGQLDFAAKLRLFKCYVKHNLITNAVSLLEWRVEMLNIAAYYNYNPITELLLCYTKSESCVVDTPPEQAVQNQLAKLCVDDRKRYYNTQAIDATLAASCYVIKANHKALKQLIANSYCFKINKSDTRLISILDEYGDDKIKNLLELID